MNFLHFKFKYSPFRHHNIIMYSMSWIWMKWIFILRLAKDLATFNTVIKVNLEMS